MNLSEISELPRGNSNLDADIYARIWKTGHYSFHTGANLMSYSNMTIAYFTALNMNWLKYNKSLKRGELWSMSVK